jgi:hypothetical protein
MAKHLGQNNFGAMNMYTFSDSTTTPESAFGNSIVNAATLSANCVPMPINGMIQQSGAETDPLVAEPDNSWALDYIGYNPFTVLMYNPFMVENADKQQAVSTATNGIGYAILKSASGRPITQSVISKYGENSNFMRPYNDTTGAPTYVPVWTPVASSETVICIHPSGFPYPQYILTTTNWLNKELRYIAESTLTSDTQGEIYVAGSIVDYNNLCSETVACYGTYLPEGRPQSMRCFNQYGGSNASVTYTISNISFEYDQLQLPDILVAQMVMGIGKEVVLLQSNTMRTAFAPLANMSSQTSVLNIKSASTNCLILYFKPAEYSNGQAQLYDSQSFLCPFTLLSSNDTYRLTSATAFQGPLNMALYKANTNQQCATGQKSAFTKRNLCARDNSLKIQFSFGSQNYPQQPITSATDLIQYYTNVQMSMFDDKRKSTVAYTMCTDSGFVSSSSVTTTSQQHYGDTSVAADYYYDCAIPGRAAFFNAFSAAQYLDNQIAIGNPNMNIPYAQAYNRQTMIGGTMSAASVAAGTLGVGLTTAAVAANVGVETLFEARGDFVLPFFMPLTCSFLIPINLANWSTTQCCKAGRWLGAAINNVTLDGMIAMNGINGSQGYSGVTAINFYTLYKCDTVFAFLAGGSVNSYI